MRIGLVLPGFSASERDWCIPALHDFVRTLSRENDVCVFALEYPYRRSSYSFFGAKVCSLNGRHRGKLYAPRLWSNSLAAIFAEHNRARFDVLHAFWANEPGLIALIAARALRIPTIASVAGGELVGLRHIGYGGQLDRLERTLVNWVVKGADRITVGSQYLQRIAARWRNDARIARLGVDTDRFSPKPWTSSTPLRIINVASLLAVKQHQVLIEAFSRMKSDSELEIIGSGERNQVLRKQTVALGISERVRFSGSVAHDAIPQKIREADLFVQASVHEAQGMAVLEAAASGVTIAGTPTGVLPELAECKAAVPAASFDAESLLESIERARGSLCELGTNARISAESSFSLEVALKCWVNIYTALV